MDINQSSRSHYKSNKSGPLPSGTQASIADAIKRKDTSAASANQELKPLDLKEGQIVKGQIIDHRYNEVSIQLEPGKQVITAKLAGDVPLSIGQNAQFHVMGDGTDRLVLKYIPNETTTPSEITIQKALYASSLPMTERNKAIVTELLHHRMPIDKQTLLTLVKLSHTNRDASPLTLVLMHKNQIPLTSANIMQFEAYQKGTDQLLNDIHSITKNITELLKKQQNPQPDLSGQVIVSQDLRGQDIVSLDLSRHVIVSPDLSAQGKEEIIRNRKLLDILYNNSDQNSEIKNTSKTLKDILGQEELSLLSKTLEQKITDPSAPPISIPTDFKQQIDQGSVSLSETIKIVTTLYDINPNQIPPSTLQDMGYLGELEHRIPPVPPIIGTLLEQFKLLQDNPFEIANILNPSERLELLDNMNAFPDSGMLKSQIEDGSITLKEALYFIHENISLTEDTAARSLLQSPEYFKLLEGAFHQKWTITPEKLVKKDAVSDLYQNLQDDLEQLSSLTKASTPSKEMFRLQEPVKNMQENLRFIKDLNEMFTYLPLPVQLKDQDVPSDLYVFTRKKALKEKNESVNVLLHLAMANLGSLNIHIQMDHNLIQAKFYLADTNAEQLITEHLPSLSDTLRKKGYHLRAEIMDTYEKPDFSKDFIEQISPDNNMQRYTFDIRT